MKGLRHKSLIATVLILLVSLTLLPACGKSKTVDLAKLKDGNYTGEYSNTEDEHPSTMKVEITIEDGKIVACEATEYDESGEVKGEEYAKIAPPAAIAVEGMKEYPGLLIEKQDPEAIDAVSGATISLSLFKEAVKDALQKAE